MTRLLEEAFAKASRLPSGEQDALGDWLLKELESENRWRKLFAGSSDALAKLAAEAVAEDEAGQTRELDPRAL